MSLRFLLLVLIFDATTYGQTTAQFQVPDAQLTYVEQELQKNREALVEKIAAINYEDPGEKHGWKASQGAWEKMDLKIGFPPAAMEEIIAKDKAQRNDEERATLQRFYLGFVNEKTRPELRSLAEKVELLQFHKQGGKNGITDPVQLEITSRFWKRRLIDPYRAKNKDKAKIRKLTIKFLNKFADDFAEDGHIGNLTDRVGRECLAAGCKHPIFRTTSFYLNSDEFNKRNYEAREDLPEIVVQLESTKYPSVVRMLANYAQYKFFRKKNFTNGEELDVAKADELDNAYNESILEMLADESKCPENFEALKELYFWTIATNFRDDRHRKACYEMISKSDLHEGFQQATLQKVIGSLANSRKLEREVRKEYLELAVDHGEKATELLPLSDSVVEQLAMNTRSYEHPEICMKWYEIGKHRAPGRYSFYKNYFDAVAALNGYEKEVEFILEILNSEDYAAGVPWIGIRLIDEGVGLYRRDKDDKSIRDSRKVVLAYEALLKKAPDQGKSPKWCKKQKQFLCHLMVQAGHFEDALKVGKELEGDFGSHQYKGQKLTLARIAELSDPLARETQESIDAGTFDIKKIEETIDKLTDARMDMDPNESTYIDELMELLESVEAFESGEWANLTPETVHLSNWQGHDSYRWQPAENGLSIKTKNSSIQSLIGWRWKPDSEYILEADLEISSSRKSYKERGAYAGFGISNGRFFNVPAVEIQLNPTKSIAVMHAFRDKEFSVKSMLNSEGSNRIRMRVWKNYFEFTINGTVAGQYAMPSAIPGHVILRKGAGASTTIFENVRVRKLADPSPIWDRTDDVSYWSKRLDSEPDSEDVKLALKNAEANQRKDGDQEGLDDKVSLKRSTLEVGEGLVALWTFDQDLNDVVSEAESQSALPTKLIKGKLGKGLLLSEQNTSNEIVSDGEGPVNLDGPFTITFWARWEGEDGVLISQTGELANLTVKLSDGDLQVKYNGAGLAMSTSLRRNLPLKTWQHITITYDGSANAKGIEAFIDGKKREDIKYRGSLPEGAQPQPPIDSSNTQMHFGCNPFAERPQFGCYATIDEVRVYNRKLSADEIQQVKSYGLKEAAK